MTLEQVRAIRTCKQTIKWTDAEAIRILSQDHPVIDGFTLWELHCRKEHAKRELARLEKRVGL